MQQDTNTSYQNEQQQYQTPLTIEQESTQNNQQSNQQAYPPQPPPPQIQGQPQNYQQQTQPYSAQQPFPPQPPAQQFQAQPTFGQPQQAYGQPQQAYGQPQQAYGQPFPQGALQQEVVMASVNNPSQSQMLCNQSRFPIIITCPYCLKSGTTRVDFKMGSGSWMCCFILFLYLCCVCCIPCFNEKCQDANHYCPHCGQVVGQCQYKVCS